MNSPRSKSTKLWSLNSYWAKTNTSVCCLGFWGVSLKPTNRRYVKNSPNLQKPTIFLPQKLTLIWDQTRLKLRSIWEICANMHWKSTKISTGKNKLRSWMEWLSLARNASAKREKRKRTRRIRMDSRPIMDRRTKIIKIKIMSLRLRTSTWAPIEILLNVVRARAIMGLIKWEETMDREDNSKLMKMALRK